MAGAALLTDVPRAAAGSDCPAGTTPVTVTGVAACAFDRGRHKLFVARPGSCPLGYSGSPGTDGMLCTALSTSPAGPSQPACAAGELPLVDLHGDLHCTPDRRVAKDQPFVPSDGCPANAVIGADRAGHVACVER